MTPVKDNNSQEIETEIEIGCIILLRVTVDPESILGTPGARWEYTPDGMPVH